jgi:hypothetical protein
MANRLPKLKPYVKLAKVHIQIDIYHNTITKANLLKIIGSRSTSSHIFSVWMYRKPVHLPLVDLISLATSRLQNEVFKSYKLLQGGPNIFWK